MSNPRTTTRRWVLATAVATGALVASQLSGVVTASASTAGRDGAVGANTASRSLSQVPYLVPEGKAKAAHPMASTEHLRLAIGQHTQRPLAVFAEHPALWRQP